MDHICTICGAPATASIGDDWYCHPDEGTSHYVEATLGPIRPMTPEEMHERIETHPLWWERIQARARQLAEELGIPRRDEPPSR